MDYESLLIGSRMEAKGSLEIGVEKGRRCGGTCGRELESPLIDVSKGYVEMSTTWPPKRLLNEDFCGKTDEAAHKERLLDATVMQNYYFGSAGFGEVSSNDQGEASSSPNPTGAACWTEPGGGPNDRHPVGQQFSFFKHQWDEPVACGTKLAHWYWTGDLKRRNWFF